jgi:hypothetical protein
LPDLDAVLAAYRTSLAMVSYERDGARMEAIFRLVMDGDRFDEPLHDRLIDAHDMLESDLWSIEALDTDRGDDWATCVLRVEALAPEACRILQACVVRALPDFS